MTTLPQVTASTPASADCTKTAWYIRPLVELVRNYGIDACEHKAQEIAKSLVIYGPMANIGGGLNSRWPQAVCIDAMHEPEMDFNTKPLPLADDSLYLVVCEQVIEHLHNTTWFLSELNRILMPGGHLILSTENLASIPNIIALLLQRAPFSTQAVCGSFIGGWKDGPAGYPDDVAQSHPTFSGVCGHVRVLTVGQIKSLLFEAGFRLVSKHGYAGNHYVLFHAFKL